MEYGTREQVLYHPTHSYTKGRGGWHRSWSIEKRRRLLKRTGRRF
ncbi:MAG: hypothetical protein ACLTSZ_02425 [Lachnospiraceae bacterium]